MSVANLNNGNIIGNACVYLNFLFFVEYQRCRDVLHASNGSCHRAAGDSTACSEGEAEAARR